MPKTNSIDERERIVIEGQAYFLTVDWCKEGRRGIFCDVAGRGFHKSGEPHTELEMQDILGPFSLMLDPKSELLTLKQVREFKRWYPLDEYSGQYGIALKPLSA